MADRVGGADPYGISTLCVDYYTATMPLVTEGGSIFSDPVERIANCLQASFNEKLSAWFHRSHFKPCNGMKRYPMGIEHIASGMLVHWGGQTEGIRISLSGAVCTYWRQIDDKDGQSALKTIISDLSFKPTRIDVAYDVGSRVSPLHIVEGRGLLDLSNCGLDMPSIRSGKIIPPRKDGDGWTVHIGSDASDFWARVYLYEPPHVRSNSTRIEFQLRDDYAKQARLDYIDKGLGVLCDTLANKCEINHPCYRPASQSLTKFRAARGATISPDTLYWLNTQVASALSRVIVEDDFDVEDWLRTSVADAVVAYRQKMTYSKK